MCGRDYRQDERLAGVVRFHGHYCPGIMVGFRAAVYGLDLLGVARDRDEEIFVICENDACGVDAIQVLTGCTLGKGNLFLKDWGKQVFTFGRHGEDKQVRLSLRRQVNEADGDASQEERRQRRLRLLETATNDELFDVRWIAGRAPHRARIFPSIPCASCGESVMEPRVRVRNGQLLCPECYDAPESAS